MQIDTLPFPNQVDPMPNQMVFSTLLRSNESPTLPKSNAYPHPSRMKLIHLLFQTDDSQMKWILPTVMMKTISLPLHMQMDTPMSPKSNWPPCPFWIRPFLNQMNTSPYQIWQAGKVRLKRYGWNFFKPCKKSSSTCVPRPDLSHIWCLFLAIASTLN